MSKKTTFKKGLLWFLLVILILPVFQRYTNVFKAPLLRGSYDKVSSPSFSYDKWMNGNYQKEQEGYIKETVGFRSFLTSLANQINYSLFNKVNPNVVLGKENYLYEIGYIKAYMGKDFIGYDSIDTRIRKLQMLQDTLKKKDIDLVTVFVPGKAAFYPEFIPNKYLIEERNTSNYEVYLEKIKEHKVIDFIDFKGWFFELKEETNYPLFPKCGIHWSNYGEYRAVDSLIHYLEKMKKINLPDLLLDKVEESTKMRNGDEDIEGPLNLLFGISDLKMAYPIYKIAKGEEFTKPKTLVISDSFYSRLFHNTKLSSKVFNKGEFWFYNNKIFGENSKEDLKVKEIDLKDKIEENEIIILISTDANLTRMSFNFIENAWDIYFQAMHEQTEAQLKQIYEQVELLKKQAQEIQDRVEVSERIYMAEFKSKPVIGKTYHLYEKENGEDSVSFIGPNEWGRSFPFRKYLATMKLLADHTWDVTESNLDN